MPLPGQLLQTGRSESEDVEEAVALSLLEDSGAGSPAPPQSGISFAHMTRMGYAATGNHRHTIMQRDIASIRCKHCKCAFLQF